MSRDPVRTTEDGSEDEDWLVTFASGEFITSRSTMKSWIMGCCVPYTVVLTFRTNPPPDNDIIAFETDRIVPTISETMIDFSRRLRT